MSLRPRGVGGRGQGPAGRPPGEAGGCCCLLGPNWTPKGSLFHKQARDLRGRAAMSGAAGPRNPGLPSSRSLIPFSEALVASALLCLRALSSSLAMGRLPDLPGAAPPWPPCGHSLSPGHQAGPVRLRWLPGSEVGILPEGGTVGQLLLPMHILACALGNGSDLPTGSRLKGLELSAPLQRGRWTGWHRRSVCSEKGAASSWAAATGVFVMVRNGGRWHLCGEQRPPQPCPPVTSSRSSSGVHGVWSVLSVW